MANTYTQLYIQFVFAVQDRASLIHSSWEEKLYQYITGIVKNHRHKMIAINGMPDHIHLFVGMHPNQSMSNLMQIVKGESSEWINRKAFTLGKFRWQEGYGAFSYSRSQLDAVFNYVLNQKEHHKGESFLDEYRRILEKFDIHFDDQYIFKTIN